MRKRGFKCDYATLAGRLQKVVDDFDAQGVSASALASWLGLHRTEITTLLARLHQGHGVTVDKWMAFQQKLGLRLEWWMLGEPPEGFSAAVIAPRIREWWPGELQRQKERAAEALLAAKESR